MPSPIHRLARLARLCACLGLLVAAGSAQAYFDHFLAGTIVGRMSRDQTATLADIYRKALNENSDGSSTAFQLPADKDAKETEGTMTPVQTTMKGEQRCRRVRSEFRQSGKTEKWSGWYCRTGDGDWRRTQMKK